MAILYWIIQPSAIADPSAAQIVAGNNGAGAAAIDSGNEISPTSGSTTIYADPVASGLTASTSYELFWVWYEAPDYSSVSKHTFSTSAASADVQPSLRVYIAASRTRSYTSLSRNNSFITPSRAGS